MQYVLVFVICIAAVIVLSVKELIKDLLLPIDCKRENAPFSSHQYETVMKDLGWEWKWTSRILPEEIRLWGFVWSTKKASNRYHRLHSIRFIKIFISVMKCFLTPIVTFTVTCGAGEMRTKVSYKLQKFCDHLWLVPQKFCGLLWSVPQKFCDHLCLVPPAEILRPSLTGAAEILQPSLPGAAGRNSATISDWCLRNSATISAWCRQQKFCDHLWLVPQKFCDHL